MIASFSVEDEREITYWINPALWGRGIASEAAGLFIKHEGQRPLYARVAQHNHGSRRALSRNGFLQIGEETFWAPESTNTSPNTSIDSIDRSDRRCFNEGSSSEHLEAGRPGRGRSALATAGDDPRLFVFMELPSERYDSDLSILEAFADAKRMVTRGYPWPQ